MISTDTNAFDENQVLVAARLVHDYFCPNRVGESPDWVLIPAIRDVMKSLPESSPEALFESLIASSHIKYRKYLSRYIAAAFSAELTTGRLGTSALPASSVFTGLRKFSFEKISGMVSFFTRRCRPISKVKLGQLLFYSDFTNFSVHSHSISGARYLREANGPALYQYESIVNACLYAGVIRVDHEPAEPEFIARNEHAMDNLSLLDFITLYWVNMNYGSMTAAEITECAERESVYRFTRKDNFIPYEYAALLARRPERSTIWASPQ